VLWALIYHLVAESTPPCQPYPPLVLYQELIWRTFFFLRSNMYTYAHSSKRSSVRSKQYNVNMPTNDHSGLSSWFKVLLTHRGSRLRLVRALLCLATRQTLNYYYLHPSPANSNVRMDSHLINDNLGTPVHTVAPGHSMPAKVIVVTLHSWQLRWQASTTLTSPLHNIFPSCSLQSSLLYWLLCLQRFLRARRMAVILLIMITISPSSWIL
jgi:hypothetical protein